MTGDDNFFGTTPTPSAPAPLAPSRPGYVTPQLGDVGAPALPPSTHSSMLPLVIGVLIAAMAGALAFAGYRILFAGPQIAMPDTLMGLERVEPDANTAQVLETAKQQVEAQIHDATVDLGIYQSNGQGIFVMAGDAGSDDIADAHDFFTGLQNGLMASGQSGGLKAVDPGSHGGDMRCAQTQNGGTCAWIDKDTFGAFFMAPVPGDLDQAAIEVRDSVEK